jgi:hypothetical protein
VAILRAQVTMTAVLTSIGPAALEPALRAALRADGVALAPDQLLRLAKLIHYCREARLRGVQRLTPPALDILMLIEAARDAAEPHEAVWRSFLGAHYGRLSANPQDGSAESAGRLLCAFGNEPVWTWARVGPDRGAALKVWLDETPAVLSLTFGNHRQHERPAPSDLMSTLRSFIDLAQKRNGPANLVKTPGASTPADRFDQLFRKLTKIHRVKRLASWDFIDLLLQMKLIIDAEPAHCYLHGATGPLEGARRIWGQQPADVLDPLAARLAKTLGVSCFVLEDALCIFQKNGQDLCCSNSALDGHCSRSLDQSNAPPLK